MILLHKNSKIGRSCNALVIGEKMHITEQITDQDLLLYLGLTNDNNPLFIQHDYAQNTIYKQPVVPPIVLNGIVFTAISKFLPGPGSYITVEQSKYIAPVYHYEIVELTLEVVTIDVANNEAGISFMMVNEKKQSVMEGLITVAPPQS
ncbi:MaoC/PaaZ C-terminal domain-containing protein [Lysinibacillus alkalisoli]|uniref:MaoC/PaaZ C-terminal domain-containing protein n=1 Tax=Lysinibacillus alkalisoli TaxID=1911548 RepID=UPI001E289D47|nr:MaoC/PaaZ C-terminal domain-containing protein [Lysinibacillus alkalisoli]